MTVRPKNPSADNCRYVLGKTRPANARSRLVQAYIALSLLLFWARALQAADVFLPSRRMVALTFPVTLLSIVRML